MNLVLAGLLFSSLVSAEPVRPACDQALQYLGAESLSARGEETDFRFVTTMGHMHYLLDVYLPEVAKAAAEPDEDTVIEFKRMLEDWNAFGRNDKERKRILTTLAAQIDNGPFFHDPGYGSKLACVFKCDEPEKCEKKCEATGFKEMNKILPLMRAAAACAVIGGESAKFIASDFETSFRRYQKQILERQKEVLSLSREMIALEKTVAKAYAPLIKQMSKYKVKKPQKYLETEFEKKMEPYVVLLDTAAGPGSGFLVTEKNATTLVTAYHVFGYDLQLNWGPEKVGVFFRENLRARKAAKVVEMKSEAGRFSRMADVLENDFPGTSAGLKVAMKGRLPELGRRFFAFGFPATSEGDLRAIPCRFYGFTQSSQGQGARYTFICDTGRDRFAGMSGGPIVDEEGVVWGVNTNVGEVVSRILIGSPIYSGEDGVIQRGLPKDGLSDLCLNRKNWARYERCQLMENQYEMQIP